MHLIPANDRSEFDFLTLKFERNADITKIGVSMPARFETLVTVGDMLRSYLRLTLAQSSRLNLT